MISRRLAGARLAAVAMALWVLSAIQMAGACVVLVTKGLDPAWLEQAHGLVPDVLMSLSVLALGAAGALITTRRPGNVVGWLLCCASLAESTSAAGRVYVGFQVGPNSELVAVVARIAEDVRDLAIVGFLMLFPNGRLPSAAWRVVAWPLGIALVYYLVARAVRPGCRCDVDEPVPGINNPFGISGPIGDLFQFVPPPPIPLIAVALAVSAVSVVVRLMRSRGVERQQLKWFAFAATLLVPGVVVLIVFDWVAGFLMLACAVAVMAAAVGVAILRYRLYDIDVIINRTLVYGSVTAVLTGLFAGLSILTQRLVLAVTGQESQAAVVLAALVLTALFQPLRARVQTIVDRRFYRRKYDATRTLEQFASQIRDEVELDQLTAGLVAVVRETMQPSHVSLWLHSGARSNPTLDRRP
jgi:hypothetical protein